MLSVEIHVYVRANGWSVAGRQILTGLAFFVLVDKLIRTEGGVHTTPITF